MKTDNDLALDTLRAFVSEYSTLADAAEHLSVSRQHLWRLLNERDRISPRILSLLGLTRLVVRK